MTIASLKMDTGNWNDIQLIIRGDVAQIIRLKDSDSALELNRILTVAYFEDHLGDLKVDIDGNQYHFTQSVWQALLSVTDQWLEEYLPATHSELFETRQKAEVIQLFG